MASVLDSSVILAIIRGETGQDKALQLSLGAAISAVNVAEVVTKCVEQNYPEEVALEVIQSCGISIVNFDYGLSILAGQMHRRAPRGLLSLGDRACLATAIRARATAVTADLVWATLDLGCPVELIR